jgi:hypothetical protein
MHRVDGRDGGVARLGEGPVGGGEVAGACVFMLLVCASLPTCRHCSRDPVPRISICRCAFRRGPYRACTPSAMHTHKYVSDFRARERQHAHQHMYTHTHTHTHTHTRVGLADPQGANTHKRTCTHTHARTHAHTHLYVNRIHGYRRRRRRWRQHDRHRGHWRQHDRRGGVTICHRSGEGGLRVA